MDLIKNSTISLHDSFDELELYLIEVSNEIMETFEDWNSTSSLEPPETEVDSSITMKSINSSTNLVDSGINKLLSDYKLLSDDVALETNIPPNWKLAASCTSDCVTFSEHACYMDNNLKFLRYAFVNKHPCLQFGRHRAEIEATEACKWLRATGFPQYAQMYEQMQFPVDLVAVQKDHPLLEPVVLQSLFRRLHALNHCANICQQPINHIDDSEDEQCALSDNWTYQSDLRRWSRNEENDSSLNTEKCENKKKIAEDNMGTSGNIIVPLATEVILKGAPEENKVLRRTVSTRVRHHRDGIVLNDSLICNLFLKRMEHIKCTDEPQSLPDSSTFEFDNKSLEPSTNICNIEKTEPVEVESRLFLENGQGRPIVTLTCTQFQILHKLAILKLTAHMEKHCPSHRTGWNWELPKFIKKIRNPAHKDNQILNLPLALVLQKIGQPLPRGIQEALEWLKLNGSDQVGLFRKPGVRSRIHALKTLVESQGENINFNEQQPYDVADMVKQYFRELPEPVLTNKLSETFILIFQYIPLTLRRESVLCALLLMPDEHREVLQSLLHVLLQIAKSAEVNQMNEKNLALCFAPSLFQYTNYSSICRQGMASINSRELVGIKAAQDCLIYLLNNNDNIYNVPKELLDQCKLSDVNNSGAVYLSELGSTLEGGWQSYMQECQSALLKEVKEKNRGWIVQSTNYSKVEMSYKKVVDGHPLKLWKVCADIDAPPSEVLHRILRERHIWDEDLHSTKIIAQMNKQSEVFYYVRRNIVPLPFNDYCVIRTWNPDLPRGACSILETSIDHSDVPNIPNSVRGIVLASRYLIEPGGSGRSRLLHLSRVDMRGQKPEWYHNNFGHICAIHIANLQNSFHQNSIGPESKV